MSIFHCCFDLDYLIRRGGAREMARGGITMGDKRMTEADIVTHATILKARGFEVMPSCSGHDARGYCRGHSSPEVPQKATP